MFEKILLELNCQFNCKTDLQVESWKKIDMFNISIEYLKEKIPTEDLIIFSINIKYMPILKGKL